MQLDEFTKWIAQGDPHLRAFAVLAEERSQKIAAALGSKDARTDVRCLACHSNPQTVRPENMGGAFSALARTERLFGVGCEACHGPAAKWLTPHTTAAWQALSAAQKQDYGMVPVKADVAARTRACAGCHVGAPPGIEGVARDVNHDLIAAGHPRLSYEPAAFLANLPPHWNTATRTGRPGKEIQTWAVGQVACAEAALRLLVHRADAALAPWPELAEYDCFACHHDLKGKSWRQTKTHYGAKHLPGALPWGDWYYSMPRLLAADTRSGDLPKAFDPLQGTMQRSLPERQQVKMQAAAAVAALEKLRGHVQQVGQTREAVGRLLMTLAGPEGQAMAQTWDSAEQLYLAAWALNQDLRDDKLDAALQRLLRYRAFPLRPEQFDSPREFQPRALFEELSKKFRRVATGN